MLTTIEDNLKSVLLSIDTTTTLYSGYTYQNSVQSVNIDDEAVADDMGGFPNIVFYQDYEGCTIGYSSQNAYITSVIYKLVCSVELDIETASPRFEIRKKMNSMQSDLLAVLGTNPTLNDSVDHIRILRTNRVYNNLNDSNRVGQLEVFVRLEFFQNSNNPNLKCSI